MTPLRALIVEDDENFRTSLAALVGREGFETSQVGALSKAREELATRTPDVLLLDLELPDGSGVELMRDSDALSDTEVIVITGHGSVDSAVEVLHEGALDYLTKPIDRARLKAVLAHVSRTRELKEELSSLRGELRKLGRFGKMVGRSKPMQEVYDLVARVGPTDATVLITGESGTGKELAAETLHTLSRRKHAPFLPVNCGAVSPSLIESELFGHEKGSFTGADRRRAGFFERASGGTLFLDEITEMPMELQVKLLRVLESGHVVRVGGSEPIEVDVRVIAATNRTPEEAVETGKLRQDLYYRLNVFPIALPPLRERKEDVEVLAEHFLGVMNREEETEKRWTPAALDRLMAHPWTGNVRELRNVVQRAFILADDEIRADAIPLPEEPARDDQGAVLQVRVGSSIADMERRLILATLEQLDGDKKRAAEILGISLKTLYNRLNVYHAKDGGG